MKRIHPDKIAGVIFDLDGVLIDSREAIRRAVREALAGMGLEERERVWDVFFRNHVTAFREAYPEFAARAPEFDRRYVTHPAHLREVVAQNHAAETLAFLKARGVGLGLATTKDRARTGAVLKKFGFCFGAVVTSDDTAATRPDPEPLRKVMAALGLAPGETLYVGDTPLDAEQARNAGVFAVCVSTGAFGAEDLAGAGPDWLCRDLGDFTARVAAVPERR